MLYPFSIVILAALASASCDDDNCLRALRATQIPSRIEAAQSFCATFTGTSVAPTAIPTYALDACEQNQKGNLTYRLASACSCIAASTTATTPTPTNPCAVVSALAASQISTARTLSPSIPAKLAQECFDTVPLLKDSAIELIDSLVPYLEWQSDLAWLKDPPTGYFYPPHDVLGSLAAVRKNVEDNVYSGEIAFELDLYSVFAKAHDGHLVFNPDGLANAFRWARQRSLVSIKDVISSPSTASAVTEIDGIDAATYVGDFAYESTFNQDVDAAYNTMFFTPQSVAGLASKSGYFAGGGRSRFKYPGDNTTFTFANGTLLTVENIAYVVGNFAGVTDGELFSKRFCTGAFDNPQNVSVLQKPITAEDPTSNPELPSGKSSQSSLPGYPNPSLIATDSSIGGYYLAAAGFEDVAVLSVLNFAPQDSKEFQHIAEEFCIEATKAGKTKLIIDLSANGGGHILQGYDLFRQFFPGVVQDGYSRLRDSDTLLEAAKIFSGATGGDFDATTSGDENLISMAEIFLNYRYDYNITNQPFQSFEEKFGPHVTKGQADTNLLRWNLDNPLTTTNLTFGVGIEITGYGTRKNFTQPFKPENIIMLTDGFCASTCSLFSEFMRLQGGVKVVTLGGRPQDGPIQAVGGVKGAQTLNFQTIYSMAQLSKTYAIKQTPPDSTKALSKLSMVPINRSVGCSVNIRDQLLPDNVNDGTPAQFVAELADCRLYYTSPMISDVSKVWEATASAAFKGGKCAAGGLPKRDIEPIVERSPVPVEGERKKIRRSPKGIKKDRLWDARHGKKLVA
ncbi:ClpP [Venustampulla echinocandica]|uniref:ClpP n=1 Tax=Venustampulla echinocandica TaxID=2656787 RepID=A0A370TJB5_9HELO|nr:ClpP [Venustampulla echinocandica]RDL35438.1 ClpP [Venustampulla echinocandica]